MPEKKCNHCNEVKDISFFNKRRSSKDGLEYKCRSCVKKIKANDWRINSEKRKASVKKWQAKNPEKLKAGNRRRTVRWNSHNRESRRLMTAKWFIENPGIRAMYSAARRAAIMRQTIPLNEDQIKQIAEIYKQAKILSYQTGIKYHVDHIIPLKAKGCSGLHVPWNLQIITADENIKKNNNIPDGATGTAFL